MKKLTSAILLLASVSLLGGCTKAKIKPVGEKVETAEFLLKLAEAFKDHEFYKAQEEGKKISFTYLTETDATWSSTYLKGKKVLGKSKETIKEREFVKYDSESDVSLMEYKALDIAKDTCGTKVVMRTNAKMTMQSDATAGEDGEGLSYKVLKKEKLYEVEHYDEDFAYEGAITEEEISSEFSELPYWIADGEATCYVKENVYTVVINSEYEEKDVDESKQVRTLQWKFEEKKITLDYTYDINGSSDTYKFKELDRTHYEIKVGKTNVKKVNIKNFTKTELGMM